MNIPTNNQKLLPAPIPFYKTRKFWVVIILFQVILSLVILYNIDNNMVTKQPLVAILYASGMATWYLIPYVISLPSISLSLHSVFLISILILIFKRKTVAIKFPIIYLTIALISLIYTSYFLTYFYS